MAGRAAKRLGHCVIFTVARTTEIRLSSVPEFETDIWQLRSERTNTGVARRIPLVAEAQAIVKERLPQEENGFLFPRLLRLADLGRRDGDLDEREGQSARPHGFRASFRTWVEEQTDAPFEVKESCLGHVVDTGGVSAYQRSDRLEKRRASRPC